MPRRAAEPGAVEAAVRACAAGRKSGRGRDSVLAHQVFRSMSLGIPVEFRLVDGSTESGLVRSCGPIPRWKPTIGRRATSLLVTLASGREVRLEDVDEIARAAT